MKTYKNIQMCSQKHWNVPTKILWGQASENFVIDQFIKRGTNTCVQRTLLRLHVSLVCKKAWSTSDRLQEWCFHCSLRSSKMIVNIGQAFLLSSSCAWHAATWVTTHQAESRTFFEPRHLALRNISLATWKISLNFAMFAQKPHHWLCSIRVIHSLLSFLCERCRFYLMGHCNFAGAKLETTLSLHISFLSFPCKEAFVESESS